MNVSFYNPKNETLSKYVDGYYFIEAAAHSEPVKYLTFPNNYHILTVFQNCQLKTEPYKITIWPSRQHNVKTQLVTRYKVPLLASYYRPVNEITMVFKPLGLNNFIAHPEKVLQQKKIEEFCPFADFKARMETIFEEGCRKEQRESLESYWLSKFQPKDCTLIGSILSAVETEMGISKIAKKHEISRQYLNTLFLKNIGKPPSEYRKVLRFRKALAKQNDCKSLTELTYEALYFDQSHFIRDFKKLTRDRTPHSFFKDVTTIEEINWLFQ